MLAPKRTKYRKIQKGNNRGLAYRGSHVSFGDFGIQALRASRLTSRQIEAMRMAVSRVKRSGGTVWVRVFPHCPVTSKPLEVRMGGGKGSVEAWAASILPGHVICELSGVTEVLAKEVFRLAAHKLPVPCRFLARSV